MDPTTTVLAALAAGAAAAAKETAGTAIKDAYEGLKGLLKKKFAGKAMATAAVDEHAKDTATAESLLRPALRETAADRDAEVLAAAQRLLSLADPQARISKNYTVNVTGNLTGNVQGDGANVTMNFGPVPPPRG